MGDKIMDYTHEDYVQAIEDARDFLDNVADDRDNAYIDGERQDEVVVILTKLLGFLPKE